MYTCIFEHISSLDISYYDIVYHTGLLQTVKYFYLTDRFIFNLQKWTKYKLHCKKSYVGGYVYISKQMFSIENPAICSTHTLTLKIQIHQKYTKITSIHTSSKPTNHAIFATSNTIKNPNYPTLKSNQTIINQALHRTLPKISYIIMK